MNRYVKGARSERELISMLKDNGYSVMRAAGSGVNSLSPDVIAFREGKGFAFECKAWNESGISVAGEKIENLKEWERNTGMETFIAWRMQGREWFFIKLDEMKKTPTSYRISKKDTLKINRREDSFFN